jgi:26S proteasome regulatory subunit N8
MGNPKLRLQDGTEKARKVFVSVPTEVGQTEAEEIGVGHLLRNVKVGVWDSREGTQG